MLRLRFCAQADELTDPFLNPLNLILHSLGDARIYCTLRTRALIVVVVVVSIIHCREDRKGCSKSCNDDPQSVHVSGLETSSLE